MPEGPKNYKPIEGTPMVELPPDFTRYREMVLELQDDMAKLGKIIENHKDKPAMVFATRIADIPNSESFALLNKSLAGDIEELDQGQIPNDKKQFAGGFAAYFAQRFLRADAILQTYVLPAIDPPSTQVQDLANGAHQMIEHLKRGMRESFSVVFDDVQLMEPPQPDSEDYRQNQGMPDQWVFFVQEWRKHPTEIRQMVVRMYRNIRKELALADPILEQARQEGTTAKLDVHKYKKVTDVRMWGYTQDGLREVQTEVNIQVGTRVLDHNTSQPE